MYFKLGKGAAWLISIYYFVVYSHGAQAQQQKINKDVQVQVITEVQFSATPTNCVALRQGRKCFAKVALSWQVTTPGDFCVQQDKKIIQCWKNSRGSQVFFEFESEQRMAYQLVASHQKKIMAETVIDVSWVHKATPRKRRWRIF